jgi:hypothetical protein
MTGVEAAERLARRAALFGAASGRHRAMQPIPRQQAGGAATHAAIDLATAPAVLAADRAMLRTGSLTQIEQQVLAILAAAKQRTVAELRAGELSEDGSLAIDSMSAVFVCRIVARVLGPHDWTSLRGNCRPRDFVSVRSIAALIRRLRRAVVAA